MPMTGLDKNKVCYIVQVICALRIHLSSEGPEGKCLNAAFMCHQKHHIRQFSLDYIILYCTATRVPIG